MTSERRRHFAFIGLAAVLVDVDTPVAHDMPVGHNRGCSPFFCCELGRRIRRSQAGGFFFGAVVLPGRQFSQSGREE